MIGSTKKLCTGQAGCPCVPCGQVRLLMEHEGQRVQVERDQRGIPTAENVQHALELTGQLEAKRKREAEQDALALKFIAQFTKEKP